MGGEGKRKEELSQDGRDEAHGLLLGERIPVEGEQLQTWGHRADEGLLEGPETERRVREGRGKDHLSLAVGVGAAGGEGETTAPLGWEGHHGRESWHSAHTRTSRLEIASSLAVPQKDQTKEDQMK